MPPAKTIAFRAVDSGGEAREVAARGGDELGDGVRRRTTARSARQSAEGKNLPHMRLAISKNNQPPNAKPTGQRMKESKLLDIRTIPVPLMRTRCPRSTGGALDGPLPPRGASSPVRTARRSRRALPGQPRSRSLR
jgi:hypothetical protein